MIQIVFTSSGDSEPDPDQVYLKYKGLQATKEVLASMLADIRALRQTAEIHKNYTVEYFANGTVKKYYGLSARYLEIAGRLQQLHDKYAPPPPPPPRCPNCSCLNCKP